MRQVSGAILICAASLLGGIGEIQGADPTQIPKKDVFMPPAGEAMKEIKHPAQMPLEVKADPALPKDGLRSYQQLATAMSKLKLLPPNARIAHYNGPAAAMPPIVGWAGFITHAKQLPEGLLVTVRVRARIERGWDSHFIIERYLVTNGQARFVDADTPPISPRFFVH